MSVRRWIKKLRQDAAYALMNFAGRILPASDRARLLRVLATGDPEGPAEFVSLSEMLARRVSE